MSEGWIRVLADDERTRDGARLRVAEATARKARLVASHAQQLLDDLHTAVVRDIEAFRSEFPGDAARAILFEPVQPDGGFVVRKPECPTASLSVTPHLAAASVSCRYRFTATGGLPPREDRVEFVLAGDGGDDTLHIKDRDTGHVFTNADALSEFLLVPVLTGRPR